MVCRLFFARIAEPSSGLEGCYLGEFTGRFQSDYKGFINKKEVDKIEADLKTLNIAELRRQRPPTYDFYQFRDTSGAELPSCNMSIVNAWNNRSLSFNITGDREMVNAKGSNHRNNWTCHARRALRMVARAFRLVDIPMLPSDGTALGWYRGESDSRDVMVC
jgi:hypothetical protein